MSGVLTMGSLDPAFAAATSVQSLWSWTCVRSSSSSLRALRPRSVTGVPERAQQVSESCTSRRTRRASLSGADELLQVVRG